MPASIINRRHFLQASVATASGLLLSDSASAKLPLINQQSSDVQAGLAAGDTELRIALIGCGGRGSGAAYQALSTSGKVRLVAMADAFSDRLEDTHSWLKQELPETVDVPPERRFTGFDAYRQAIDCDVDVVVLATPPGFRPIHFEYAIDHGKHVFMEKPVAVDGPGVRRVLASAAKAKKTGQKVGVGLQRRHQDNYIETIRQIHEGAIGKITLLRCYWNSAGVWVRERQQDWNEMEYQMRNWYYFNWLCGDHITEQHIHNLDVCNWAMGAYPVRAQGQGGRLLRNGIDHGQIFDHHMVEFTYADGTKMLSQCRHMPETKSEVNEYAHGTDGIANIGNARITFYDNTSWAFDKEYKNPYQKEHDVLFSAIRSGAPHCEADNGAFSTLTSILGRMATYSGQEISWQQALQSDVDLSPDHYAWNAAPPVLPDADGCYPIPIPGKTKVF